MAGWRASVALLLAVTPLPATADPLEMHSYVTMAGVEYRVSTLDERVRVASDPAPAQASSEMRERMTAAVREATGCRIADDRWEALELHGRLDCTDRLPLKVR